MQLSSGSEQNSRGLELQVQAQRQELNQWRRYKVLLSATGDRLRLEVASSLRHYFGLAVGEEDKFREDLTITNEAGDTIAAVEVKATKGGVQREHINQVDNHRERNGLSPVTPGLLIINNATNRAGISARLEADVAPEQVRHAKAMNVLVFRTIDLLFLMRHLEESPNPGAKFIELVQAGGGWLKADSDGFRLEVGEGS